MRVQNQNRLSEKDLHQANNKSDEDEPAAKHHRSPSKTPNLPIRPRPRWLFERQQNPLKEFIRHSHLPLPVSATQLDGRPIRRSERITAVRNYSSQKTLIDNDHQLRKTKDLTKIPGDHKQTHQIIDQSLLRKRLRRVNKPPVQPRPAWIWKRALILGQDSQTLISDSPRDEAEAIPGSKSLASIEFSINVNREGLTAHSDPLAQDNSPGSPANNKLVPDPVKSHATALAVVDVAQPHHPKEATLTSPQDANTSNKKAVDPPPCPLTEAIVQLPTPQGNARTNNKAANPNEATLPSPQDAHLTPIRGALLVDVAPPCPLAEAILPSPQSHLKVYLGDVEQLQLPTDATLHPSLQDVCTNNNISTNKAMPILVKSPPTDVVDDIEVWLDNHLDHKTPSIGDPPDPMTKRSTSAQGRSDINTPHSKSVVSENHEPTPLNYANNSPKLQAPSKLVLTHDQSPDNNSPREAATSAVESTPKKESSPARLQPSSTTETTATVKSLIRDYVEQRSKPLASKNLIISDPAPLSAVRKDY
ncbi:hypothetical protein PCANC_21409 [Puccinia coronata f. sp. avenae]|uniref:Uncharacterized protein n=1 Tax=Puccinia coronata f. sp. avenae TaxID=200324 RepID=A0A2N5UTE7_9BASI|nr:hypothetical protein PCANC_21409 [Puccinia coronata f. sp. avenae]